ncbi:hypothetical protein ACFTSF_30160 [Kribbella sp. NPDC056951]|uniref:Uncharacterized protein n=1 Tax=Kribbella yunnanensis TaxID=190194 RepID=A0ABP4UER7_9ACTN
MPTATLDEFDLDIKLAPAWRPRIDQPMLSGTRPDSEQVCCTDSCPINCQTTTQVC